MPDGPTDWQAEFFVCRRRAMSVRLIIPMLTRIVTRYASKLKMDSDEGQAGHRHLYQIV